MTTSILSSIGSLLSGTSIEEFKKLFQPASLVAAALFLALNLVFVYPFLIEQRVHFVLVLQSMGAVAQLALLSLLILAVGYLIASLGPSFLSLVTGNSLRDARLVQDTFTRRERARFQKLKDDLRSQDKSVQAWALHKLAFEFPLEAERFAPSRLGNAVDSVASYTWHQYGADLDTLWPVMDQALKDKNPEMQARIQQSQTSLTFFASLVVLLLLVLLELLVLRVALGRPGATAVLAMGALLLLSAHLVYRAAVRAALAWSRDMRAAFDLYTAEVETSLGLRTLEGMDREEKGRDRLQRVSWWLAHGAVAIPDKFKYMKPARDPDWYQPATAPPPDLTLTTAPGLKVQSRIQVVDEWDQRWESEREVRLPGRIIQYLLAVSNEQSGENAQVAGGSFVIVQDARLPALPDSVSGTLTGASAGSPPPPIHGQRLPGSPGALLWDLGDIPPQASRLLSYKVGYDVRVRVAAPAEIEALTVPPGLPKDQVTPQDQVATTTGSPKDQVEIEALTFSPGSPRVQVDIVLSDSIVLGDSARAMLTAAVRVANKHQMSAAAQYAVEDGADGEAVMTYDAASQQWSWTIPGLSQGARVRTLFWLEPL